MRGVGIGTLLLVAAVGCVQTDAPPTSVPWQSLRVHGDPGPDRVLLDVALVQAPLGDAFLDDDLWASVDTMTLPFEIRESLEVNGFRVGVLVGSSPAKLLRCLESERTCVERKGRSTPSGETLTQTVRTSIETCRCALKAPRVEVATWVRPQFGFDLQPQLVEGGKVRLRATPRVEAGDRAMTFKADPVKAEWAMEMERPIRRFADLAFELDLAPNQLLVIGARTDLPDTLGACSFIQSEGDAPTQRVLVLRQVRPSGAGAHAVASAELVQRAASR